MMYFQSAFIAVAFLAASMAIADDNLDESKAIEKIELLGGKVAWDESESGEPMIGVDLRGSKRFNDKYLHLLDSFTGLTVLNLPSTRITDEGLRRISQYKSLKKLCLGGTRITDAGLKELGTLPSLTMLSLYTTRITDDGLKELTFAFLTCPAAARSRTLA